MSNIGKSYDLTAALIAGLLEQEELRECSSQPLVPGAMAARHLLPSAPQALSLRREQWKQ